MSDFKVHNCGNNEANFSPWNTTLETEKLFSSYEDGKKEAIDKEQVQAFLNDNSDSFMHDVGRQHDQMEDKKKTEMEKKEVAIKMELEDSQDRVVSSDGDNVDVDMVSQSTEEKQSQMMEYILGI